MARVDYPDLATADASTLATAERIKEQRGGRLLNLFRMQLWNPAIADAWLDLGSAVRFKSELDAPTRELAGQIAANWQTLDAAKKVRAVTLTGGANYNRQCAELMRGPAVVIATPEHLHHRMLLDALAAGKHVYVEKPLAHTMEECFEIMKVGAKGTMPAGVHHYAAARGATVVAVTAMGPFAMTYVNPADNPQTARHR